jgi:hypothetical protein
MKIVTWVLMACAFLGVSTMARAEISVTRIDIGLPNTAVFHVVGEYDGQEILRFKSAIADVPPTVRIVAALNSPGGRLDQGIELGKFFYSARIATLVLAGDICASSCTNAFFGGRDPHTGKPMRILASGAKLGFHNFKSYDKEEKAYTKAEIINRSRNSQKVVYEWISYLKSVEAPVKAIALSLATPHEDVYWLTESEALTFDITVLNLELGRFVLPSHLASRTR